MASVSLSTTQGIRSDRPKTSCSHSILRCRILLPGRTGPAYRQCDDDVVFGIVLLFVDALTGIASAGRKLFVAYLVSHDAGHGSTLITDRNRTGGMRNTGQNCDKSPQRVIQKHAVIRIFHRLGGIGLCTASVRIDTNPSLLVRTVDKVGVLAEIDGTLAGCRFADGSASTGAASQAARSDAGRNLSRQACAGPAMARHIGKICASGADAVTCRIERFGELE